MSKRVIDEIDFKELGDDLDDAIDRGLALAGYTHEMSEGAHQILLELLHRLWLVKHVKEGMRKSTEVSRG